MTPKEKAIELVSSMDFSNYDKAKQCALICVDEIINSNPMQQDSEDTGRGIQYWYFSDIKYWEEVKQEINKL